MPGKHLPSPRNLVERAAIELLQRQIDVRAGVAGIDPGPAAPNGIRPVPGADRRYWVTPSGRVWSMRTLQFLKPQFDKDGYPSVGLCLEQQRYLKCRIHLLVVLTWIGMPPRSGMLVRHLDDVKTNNNVENLAWGTFWDNARDAVINRRRRGA